VTGFVNAPNNLNQQVYWMLTDNDGDKVVVWVDEPRTIEVERAIENYQFNDSGPFVLRKSIRDSVWDYDKEVGVGRRVFGKENWVQTTEKLPATRGKRKVTLR
jgi:hypothetical protein